MAVVGSFRRHAQKHHTARHLLQHIGEILRPHHGCGHRRITLFAEQIVRHLARKRHCIGIVLGHRIPEFILHGGGKLVRGGDVLGHAADAFMRAGTRRGGEAA